MTCRCSPLNAHTAHIATQHYFVCMMDYRSAGQEAVVDPEITRAEVISRLKTREYRDVLFIHEIRNGIATDVTLELIGEARGLVFA